MSRPDTDDYKRLFLEDIPLMDVRAPVEFNKGAFPNSQNIPILDDHQRESIGTCYKDSGQDAAIALGLQLAVPEIRQQRLDQWEQFTQTHPTGYLYCFRGGLRSRTTQAWLKDQGNHYPLIKSGYKAMRTFLIQQMELSVAQIPFLRLSGFTGSGKTRVLKKAHYHIDLEGLSNHRGSAFGGDVNDFQPTQIDWENSVSIAFLKYHHNFAKSGVLLEDEGKRIGRNILQDCLYEKMQQSPCIFLERELDQRVAIIQEDYISSLWPIYQQQFKDKAFEKFSAFVLDNLAKIKKRLGGLCYKKINNSFSLALAHLFGTGEAELFDEGIRLLLLEYYDPMYQYQLQQKHTNILFKGTEPEIIAWADEYLENMS